MHRIVEHVNLEARTIAASSMLESTTNYLVRDEMIWWEYVTIGEQRSK